MANTLLITKETGGYFTFLLTKDGVTQTPVQSIKNDLLVYGSQCHFKTGNGANIIKEQYILPTDITLISGGSFTFTNTAQLWAKLIEISFFEWLGAGSGTGVDRFSDLIDTFNYFGKSGQCLVVDQSEQKLVTIPIYNIKSFTELEDTPSALVPNKMVVVNSAGTALELQDKPVITPPSLTSVGSFHYVDLATKTTPLNVLAGVEKRITNDTADTSTNTLNAPYGISYMWDNTNNQLELWQTAIGDLVTIIPAIEITTTIVNQEFQIYVKLGIGSTAPVTKAVYNGTLKNIGTIKVNPTRDFTIDSPEIRDYPGEIFILTDANATVKSGELDIKVVRKDINIVSSDPSKQNKLVAGTNVTIDVTDPLNPVINAVSGDTTETAATIKTKYESNADTNALTDTLKTNYDAAYTHSQTTHAPNNAQKNSDITKAEIEAKLIGEITTHTHPSVAATIQPIRNISGTYTFIDADSGQIFILTANCTVTISNGLIANFEATLVTLAGATLTTSLGTSVTLLNNTGTTMAEKLSVTIKQTLTANQFLTVGNL